MVMIIPFSKCLPKDSTRTVKLALPLPSIFANDLVYEQDLGGAEVSIARLLNIEVIESEYTLYTLGFNNAEQRQVDMSALMSFIMQTPHPVIDIGGWDQHLLELHTFLCALTQELVATDVNKRVVLLSVTRLPSGWYKFFKLSGEVTCY